MTYPPHPCLRRSACPPHKALAGGASCRQAAGESLPAGRPGQGEGEKEGGVSDVA